MLCTNFQKEYEGDSRSNANLCVISFNIAIFQDSLHQNYDVLSIFPDPITVLTESHSNKRMHVYPKDSKHL